MRNKPKAPISAELAGIDAAIKRAARAAHTLARKTNTPCYIWKDCRLLIL
jgi:hypothetical protein